MSMNITHFKVGNGHCSLIQGLEFVMIIDLNKTADKDSSYELLKPFFRRKDGKYVIDILAISQNDKDHCCGFARFKEEMDKGNLVIGSIWHQDYDRTKTQDIKDLPTDYLVLREEIKRREKVSNPQFGDVVKTPKAKEKDGHLFEKIDNKPESLSIRVLSPFAGDNEDTPGYDHNCLSLVMNVQYGDISKLYTGDSSSKYWQDKIIPQLLNHKMYKDWAEADIVIASHHGSYTFFGCDRDEVCNCEKPDNYEALERITPNELILSACTRFPTGRDANGDQPPHYAAYKWYHKWFRDNRGVSDDDKHPDQFKYTADGNVRLEYNEVTRCWEWNNDWDHNVKQILPSAASVRPESKFG